MSAPQITTAAAISTITNGWILVSSPVATACFTSGVTVGVAVAIAAAFIAKETSFMSYAPVEVHPPLYFCWSKVTETV